MIEQRSPNIRSRPSDYAGPFLCPEMQVADFSASLPPLWLMLD